MYGSSEEQEFVMEPFFMLIFNQEGFCTSYSNLATLVAT